MSSVSPDAAEPRAEQPASADGDALPASADVVAPQARVELDRIRRRWAELPLGRAEARMPLLRRLLADLTPRSSPPPADSPPAAAAPGASHVGDPHEVAVPDLGPAVVVDQLAVLVWDAYAAGRGDGIPELLVALRRALA
ncbi:MAG: hypothetical protein ACJ714_09765 [Ornithinibacter sp.]